MTIESTQRGVSLIEMLVAIVVFGLAIPPLTRSWYDVTTMSTRAEAMADAGAAAAWLMEDITARRFDEDLNPPWTPKASFGAKRPDEADETNWDTYDDVDDFDGYTTTDTDGFTRMVEVAYATLNGSQWEACTTETDFKRVTVRVSRPRMGVVNVTMTTIIGRY